MNDILLDIKNLKIQFPTDEGVVVAVDGASFTVRRGETLCLVGESGCGKSVTARAILQIVHKPGQIVGGQMLYYGHLANGNSAAEVVDIAQLDPMGEKIRAIRGKEIAMIFQEPMTALSPLYTVGNQIMESIQLHDKVSKTEARNRAIELLRKVGIPKPEQRVDEYPFRLSGGMRQRAMIAVALSCNPQFLIADEPTTALDVTTQAQIIDLMQQLQEDYGMALLFITHDLGVVAEIADEVAVMYLGHVVECSSVRTIFKSPKHPYTQALLNSIPKITPERRRLNPIQGMVPSPFARPSGCPFHPRCSQAIADVCNRTIPELVRLNENHQVRCILYGGDANPLGEYRESTTPDTK
jgi:oligopeptide/dipeptide ABC transporter ATP-binding protein